MKVVLPHVAENLQKRLTQTRQSANSHWQRLPMALAAAASAVARNGRRKHNPLILKNKNRLYHKNPPDFSLKPLILLSETALQLQLRQVCRSDRAAGPKPLLLPPIIHTCLATASKIAQRFGTAAQLLVINAAITSPLVAEGWGPVASGAGWSSADRFSSASATATGPSATDEPTRRVVPFVRAVRQSQGPQMDRLLTLISQAESPVIGRRLRAPNMSRPWPRFSRFGGRQIDPYFWGHADPPADLSPDPFQLSFSVLL